MSVLFNVSLDSGPSRMVSVSEQGKVRDLLKIAEAAFCAPEADCHSLAVLREEYVELDKDQPISEISERELILVVTEDGSLIERLSVLCGSVDIDLSSFGNSELTEKSKDGKNLLHYGAMRNKEVLDFLLQKNLFDIDVRDSIGQTPLLLAAQFNSPDIVLTLLNAGADIKAMDSQKRTFLHHLCMNTWKDGCNELFSKAFAAKLHPFLYSSQRSTAAHYAALSGNTNAMQLFIEKFNFPLDLVDGYVRIEFR